MAAPPARTPPQLHLTMEALMARAPHRGPSSCVAFVASTLLLDQTVNFEFQIARITPNRQTPSSFPPTPTQSHPPYIPPIDREKMAPKRNANRDITPSSAATTQSSTTSAASVPSGTTPTTTLNTAPARHFRAASANAKQSPAQIVSNVWTHYVDETPQRTKLIDAFMAFLMVVGALQFLYCVLAGNYPFNAFLSGFGATVGQFVLTGRFSEISSEKRGCGMEDWCTDRR
ncbi:oligosaccharyltransferase complex subunit epsilon [Coniochaeta pulveracea]|uniref:Dolichyl-diphosphooligosaccharide--protein glycosyltransferase subunit OST2 n=1 Tax=Coniochaeta pulveracea TaxID=177199 RepID=A0A420YE46_9PEZI|nr:oligosaccharyltransferase complex subunit epsilon [Coniochaeta pulveracea]